MLSAASKSSTTHDYEEDPQILMSDYSVPDNISARRHLIRAVRESMISMEQREASKRKEWDNEIQKLSTLNTEAAQLIINIESNVQRLCVVCQDRE